MSMTPHDKLKQRTMSSIGMTIQLPSIDICQYDATFIAEQISLIDHDLFKVTRYH